jgi:1-aminocyclopropane-1-carboxylate deaminase/D-cysteine desulfhydrase-like pyridoxal-dependent ACC family enzyme
MRSTGPIEPMTADPVSGGKSEQGLIDLMQLGHFPDGSKLL